MYTSWKQGRDLGMFYCKDNSKCEGEVQWGSVEITKGRALLQVCDDTPINYCLGALQIRSGAFRGAGAHCPTTEFLEHRQDIPQPTKRPTRIPLIPLPLAEMSDIRTCGLVATHMANLRLPCIGTVTTYARDKALE